MSVIIPWCDLSEMYGFLGNSLLRPMTPATAIGIDPAFWVSFPSLGEKSVQDAIGRCKRYAESAKTSEEKGSNSIERVAVEYTRLFVGPPSPAAPPWETMYRNEGTTVGYGTPTFEMRSILREVGIGLGKESKQYEDHMGIELLYLSARCSAMDFLLKEGEGGESDEIHTVEQTIAQFIESHPLDWIERFLKRVEKAFPDGYFASLLSLAHSILEWHNVVLRGGVIM